MSAGEEDHHGLGGGCGVVRQAYRVPYGVLFIGMC
jgi:hypothetical protein